MARDFRQSDPGIALIERCLIFGVPTIALTYLLADMSTFSGRNPEMQLKILVVQDLAEEISGVTSATFLRLW